MPQHTGYQVGDYVWYEQGWSHEPGDRRVWTVRLVSAEVVAIGPKRVTIKLTQFPQFRARNVSPSKVWW